MDAVEYVKVLRRMCKCQPSCNACPLYSQFGCFSANMSEAAEKAIPFVEQRAKDHPVKTRQSEFLKMFPNADMQRIYALFPCVMDQTIRPTRCVKYESFSSPKKCVECRKDYWNEEVTDND